jgi:hypothetical protein
LKTQRFLDPFRFLLIALSEWMNQRQLLVIDYLREENRVLREQLGGRRVRLDDDQRRRLAVRAKALGRKILAEVASIVTPETLLAWHWKLVHQKYDGTAHRAPERPRIAGEIEALVVRMAEENRGSGYWPIEGALFRPRGAGLAYRPDGRGTSSLHRRKSCALAAAIFRAHSVSLIFCAILSNCAKLRLGFQDCSACFRLFNFS